MSRNPIYETAIYIILEDTITHTLHEYNHTFKGFCTMTDSEKYNFLMSMDKGDRELITHALKDFNKRMVEEPKTEEEINNIYDVFFKGKE